MIKRFLPSRKEVSAPEVVTDLDALVSSPVAFKFQGRVHQIKPIQTGELMALYENFAAIDGLMKQKEITTEEVIEFYVNFFGSVCDTIKKSDIEQMTQSQCSALVQLVFDSVTGRIQGQKKKLADRYQFQQSTLLC